MSLPSGTVTFVFSDIEGSTSLLKRLGDTEYATLLAVHRRLVRDIFAAHEGQEIDTQGDAFFYSFVRARQAVQAAVDLQRAHVKASWPGGLQVRVRLGLHTGEPAVGDEGYTGLDVVRASRIAAVGLGGQVLISDTTRAIVAGDLADGVTIRGLGERQLKDIDRPEQLFELVIEDVTPPVDEPMTDAPAGAPRAEPPGAEPPGTESKGAESPFRQIVDHTRQQIESRVLAQLSQSLGGDFLGPAGIPGPPPRRPVSKEIARLRGLHESGALTDAQYERAVDKLLDDEASSD